MLIWQVLNVLFFNELCLSRSLIICTWAALILLVKNFLTPQFLHVSMNGSGLSTCITPFTYNTCLSKFVHVDINDFCHLTQWRSNPCGQTGRDRTGVGTNDKDMVTRHNVLANLHSYIPTRKKHTSSGWGEIILYI